MTSDTTDCLLLGFIVIKKIGGNLRDQKLVGCLLHDSLGIDALKTIKMSDFSAVVEPEAEVPVKRIKKQWFIQCSQLPYLVRVRLELLKIKLPLFTADPLHIPDALSIADSMVISKKEAKSYFQIPVTNTSSTNIFIKKNEVMRKLEFIS